MKVRVDLYVNLKKYASSGDSSFEIQIESGATIKTVLEVLKIPKEEKLVVLINGRNADESGRLKEKDTITLYSPISGG
ncbi:MAG: MoaD/ThiS family protein [Deltaproteobacteria bacterium]|jgi:sulfur carrier protein ThiS|nr:MoaD/ThiS family protein [Deltaproteobacteria bacterium]